MNKPLVAMALVAAGLAGVVGFELLPWAAEADREPGVAVAARVVTSDAPAVPAATGPSPAATSSILLARPLFSQTRRPPDAAEPTATAASSSAPLPRMTAILIDGSNRRAIFVGGEGGKAVIVVEGGRVGAFTVQSIGPQQVTLTGPDGPRTVRTTFDPAAQSPAPLAAGFVQPQFPGIQVPGMPVSGMPGVSLPGIPLPAPPMSPTPPSPALDGGSSPGAAR